MYFIKKISYDLDIVEQFIVPQFKCPDYKSRLMLTIDTKLMGSTYFYISSENSPSQSCH